MASRKRIGKGTYGTVYLVREEDGREYVDKVVSLEAEGRADFEKEITALAALDHPCITRFLGARCDEQGYGHILMEYAPNGTLRDAVVRAAKEKRSFSEEQVVDWFVQLALGLEFMHGNRILHRDLKSENVFLGADGRLLLGDFGVARIMSSNTQYAMTQTGTPWYLSPEVITEEAYNHKSDMWALGCLLHEMVTLARPFVGRNFFELVQRITNVDYASLDGRCSENMQFLIGALLLRDPDERPDVSEILELDFLADAARKWRAVFAARGGQGGSI